MSLVMGGSVSDYGARVLENIKKDIAKVCRHMPTRAPVSAQHSSDIDVYRSYQHNSDMENI